jgi:hypothetical protein
VVRSGPDEDFEGFTGVHGPVAVGHGVETDLATWITRPLMGLLETRLATLSDCVEASQRPFAWAPFPARAAKPEPLEPERDLRLATATN